MPMAPLRKYSTQYNTEEAVNTEVRRGWRLGGGGADGGRLHTNQQQQHHRPGMESCHYQQIADVRHRRALLQPNVSLIGLTCLQ